jgi:hypothetical protein
MEHLREFSSYSALKRNYEEGGKADRLYELLREELEMRSSELWEEPELNSAEFEELVQAKEREFQSEIEDYDSVTVDKRDQFEKRLKSAEEEFERHWREDCPKKYRKPSARLIVLYEIERKLGLTSQFEQAKIAKRETEALERQEMDAAQRLLRKDYTAAREQFLKEQRDERRIFEDTRKHWKDVMLARHKVVMEAVVNRGHVLNQKQIEARPQKESSLNPTTKRPENAGNAVVYHRESVQQSGHLLPPLLPPNDDLLKEKMMKEIEEQREKLRRFQQFQAQKKALEEDTSSASGSASSETGPERPELGTPSQEAAEPPPEPATELTEPATEPIPEPAVEPTVESALILCDDQQVQAVPEIQPIKIEITVPLATDGELGSGGLASERTFPLTRTVQSPAEPSEEAVDVPEGQSPDLNEKLVSRGS